MLQQFEREIDRRSKEGNSVRCGADARALLQSIYIQAIAKNPFCATAHQLSKQTLEKAISSVPSLVVRYADIKTSARVAAYQNVRNHLSLCACVRYLLSIMDSELFFSSDDVSLLINDKEKPKVLTTIDAIAHLQRHNIGVSTLEDVQKRRVVTFNITISPVGTVVCAVMKFCDRTFIDLKNVPKVFAISQRFFVMLYHPSLSETVVAEYQYRLCIIPCAAEIRAAVIKRESTDPSKFELTLADSVMKRSPLSSTPISTSTSQSSSSTSTSVLPVENNNNDEEMTAGDEESTIQMVADHSSLHSSSPSNENDSLETVSSRFQWLVLACDGAHPQIDLILNGLGERCKNDGQNILFFKYSAACSMVQSPNDQGRMHSILHRLFKSKFDYFSLINDASLPRGKAWDVVRQYCLSKLPGPSFSTFWQCCQSAEIFINKAFTQANVVSAFRASGIFPFSPERILSHCPFFVNLNHGDAKFILDLVIPLSQYVSQHGMVHEAEFERVFEHKQHLDNCPSRRLTQKPLNGLTTNRQRALIPFHDAYVSSIASREQQQRKRSSTDAGNNTAAVASKRPRKRYCTFCRTDKNFEAWTRCENKSCRKIYCSSCVSNKRLEQHKNDCSKSFKM